MLVVRPSHGGGAPLGIDLDGGTTFSVTSPHDAPDSDNAGADGAAVPDSLA